MSKRILLAGVLVLIAAAVAPGLVGAASAPPIQQCPGGSCEAEHCSACCVEGQRVKCSWWSCGCKKDRISSSSVNAGRIIDP